MNIFTLRIWHWGAQNNAESKDSIPIWGWKIVPAVRLAGNKKGEERREERRHLPEPLLKHLTTQIIRNFILKSPQLEKVDSQEIHLTLTMPNVYSLTHVEHIKKFVKEHTGVAKVDALYESDAVAYCLFHQTFGKELENFVNFRNKYFNCKADAPRILTIDIGRGTTDLSLIRIENAVDLITELKKMALAREYAPFIFFRQHRLQKEILNPSCTFILVAGQASQFKPLRKAIQNELRGLHLPESHCCFLEGKLAKEACCVGAVTFKRKMSKQLNPRRIHGTLGMLAVAGREFERFDMSKIKDGGGGHCQIT